MSILLDEVKNYIALRQEQDRLEERIKVVQKRILDSADFNAPVVHEGYELVKVQKRAFELNDGVEVPQEYSVKVFDQGTLMEEEPSTWKRIERYLMTEYPEYVAESLDMVKFQKENPDSFTEKINTHLKLTKPKKSAEPVTQVQDVVQPVITPAVTPVVETPTTIPQTEVTPPAVSESGTVIQPATPPVLDNNDYLPF